MFTTTRPLCSCEMECLPAQGLIWLRTKLGIQNTICQLSWVWYTICHLFGMSLSKAMPFLTKNIVQNLCYVGRNSTTLAEISRRQQKLCDVGRNCPTLAEIVRHRQKFSSIVWHLGPIKSRQKLCDVGRNCVTLSEIVQRTCRQGLTSQRPQGPTTLRPSNLETSWP